MRSYPSMQGGVQPSKRRLRLRIRASNVRARSGSTFWSAPVALDALGGAAVVMVPTPTHGTAAAMVDSPAAYMLAVTAAQVNKNAVPCCWGICSLHLSDIGVSVVCNCQTCMYLLHPHMSQMQISMLAHACNKAV